MLEETPLTKLEAAPSKYSQYPIQLKQDRMENLMFYIMQWVLHLLFKETTQPGKSQTKGSICSQRSLDLTKFSVKN